MIKLYKRFRQPALFVFYPGNFILTNVRIPLNSINSFSDNKCTSIKMSYFKSISILCQMGKLASVEIINGFQTLINIFIPGGSVKAAIPFL